jgi:cytochrome oxidase assembly protein ShyY1
MPRPPHTDPDVQPPHPEPHVEQPHVEQARTEPVDGMHSGGVWRTALSVRWIAMLAAALVLAGVMTALGVWQLDVYRSKTAAATAARTAQPPVPIGSLMSVDEGLPGKAVGRRVTVSGRWAAASDQLYVSDRVHEGRSGLWVVTPLLVDDGVAVLVVRGWVPSTSAPDAAAPAGKAEVVGTVIASEADDASGAAARGRVLPTLRIPTIVGMVGYRLYDAFVVLSSSTPDAGTPVPVQPPGAPTDHAGLRNIAYAVQWWIFAAFVLFMWWRMMSDAHRAGRGDAAGTVSA